MSRRSPDEALLTAIVAALRSSTSLTTLATGGIYSHVPQGTTFPYVEVSLPTARREDAFAQYGAETTLDVKAISQGVSEQEGLRMRDYAIQALNAQSLSVSGHTAFGIRWDSNERFEELINGVRTKHHVASFLVWTGQSSS